MAETARTPKPDDFDKEYDESPSADETSDTAAESDTAPKEASPVAATFASASDAAKDVAASTVAATTAAATSVSNFTKTNTGMTIAILVVGVVVAFVIAYVIYWFIDYTINDRSKYMLKASRMPIVATKITTLTDGNKIPGATNGKRMSFTFWIYIYDINKYQGTDRHVFHRSQYDADKEEVACPYVVLDKNLNKLHITFPPRDPKDKFNYNGTPIISDTDAATTPDDIKKLFFRTVRGITIDYVPIQRWVHIGVVANEEVNGGILTAYVDGELVKNVTTNTSQITLPNLNKKVGLDLTRAGLDTSTGPVFVGGSPTSAIGPGFSGMVSKITFFNYDLNAKDVYDNYLNGPIDSLLAKMGLPAYGIQSPIYRIS